MDTEQANLSEQEERLGEIAFAYLEAREGGQAPSEQELLARHPEFAEELAGFIASRNDLEEMAAPLREVARLATTPGPEATFQESGQTSPTDGPRLFGDYELLEEIGRGGMGVVYKSAQKSLGRTVALKVLPFAATADARQLQRFQNEAR